MECRSLRSVGDSQHMQTASAEGILLCLRTGDAGDMSGIRWPFLRA